MISSRLRLSVWVGAIGAMALIAAIAGCQGDDGPMGPEGPPGTGTEQCMDCHTDDFQAENFLGPIQVEYDSSLHATTNTFLRRGAVCARCHTAEGFQHFAATGEAVAVTESSPIGCFACHAPHTRFDFGMRKQGPTDLRVHNASFTDYVNHVYDKGTSNTCAACHQGRTYDFAQNPIGNFRWGPHYSTQANVLAGAGAYQFAGAIYQNGTHGRGIENGCSHCHMATPPESGLAGGHTFSMRSGTTVNNRGCACHDFGATPALTTAAVNAQQERFNTRLHDLGDELFARGWLQDNRHYVNPAGVPADPNARGALHNYMLLERDGSGSVHNVPWAESVLDATIAWVAANPPPLP